ncbi:transposase [Spiroplasma helicoides]|uniref:Transposase n=1 Tax=Spiroplasma helicoides TaxID=216938 RepID=A0A1B3SKF8_9MOLU|nr:transposase [Spiroplasma helicoides]
MISEIVTIFPLILMFAGYKINGALNTFNLLLSKTPSIKKVPTNNKLGKINSTLERGVEFFMSKNLTVEEWMKIIQIYKKQGIQIAEQEYRIIKAKQIKFSQFIKKRIKQKTYLVDNYGMKSLNRKKGSGRYKKRDDSDIPGIISDLTEEQKREIIEDWIKSQRDKKERNAISKIKSLNISMKARIISMHRTTFYKKPKVRRYKYNNLKNTVEEILKESKFIYGSRKISVLLKEKHMSINDRTLRHYLKRWGFIIKTRIKKRQAESKNINTKFKDLVKRNYNPTIDNIIATDVSYIPGLVEGNNYYLSAAISHKTKKIESWCLSKNNNSQLVIDTLNKINKSNFILHSDHGSQYSSNEVIELVKQMNCQTSMSRVGNSLDNREIEYFFSCLKGEYLNHINTNKMNIDEIYNHIDWYIDWYNNKRIQKILNWKTPATAGAII